MYSDMSTHFQAAPEIRARNSRKGTAKFFFFVVRTTPIARQRVAKHIPAEADARNNRRYITR
jgi:hypothetical protein